MQKAFILALFFCACFAVALSESSDDDGDVVVLTDSTFSDFVKENEFAFVEFYAPWCGHCKHLAPEWKKLATALKGKVPVAKVDCTAEQTVCSDEGVEGYPTIKFFKKGNSIPYQSERSAEVMQTWVEKKLGDAFKTISAAADFEELVKSPVVVGFFASKDTELFKLFSDLASSNDDLTFAAVFDSSASSDYAENTVKAYRPGQAAATFANQTAFHIWVNDYAYPLVDRLGQQSYGRVTGNNKKFVVILFAPQEEADALSKFESVASNYRNDLGFLWDHGEHYQNHASRLGISGDKFPVLVGMDTNEKFFPGSEIDEFSTENIKSFLDKLIAGEASAHQQSEPVPEANDEPVRVIVGKTFESEIFESKKPVFLEVYAPWCGHCKQLTPIWEDLAKAYQGKNIVIAKLDGTANDIPVKVTGFPTLLLFKGGKDSEPVSYEGDRTLEALKSFVDEHISSEKDEL